MKYKVKSRKLLINEYFKVEKAQVEFDQHFSDQSVEVQRFNLLRGFAVAPLIYHRDKNAIIMVKQFRYSTADAGDPWLLELPAGLVEKDEDPRVAVKRETIEETGYKVDKFREISRFFVAPGCTDEQIILYYAEVSETDRISDGGGVPDEHEDIKLIFIPVSELQSVIDEGKIKDAKSIIAFYWFLNNRK
ncbi:MAG: NUDIX hydrolase [Candidatus Cloacimonetes bacterium]|nr:NUDIX hydrolase [Candidatus Cloacimonadota bacterium]